MTPAGAQDSDLAKKLSNPVASLISVPFQWNYDHGFGPADGNKVTLNVQPVVPFSLNEDWNLISRTILPVVWQDDISGNSGTQFGLSDTTQSFFFSPKEPTSGGIIWGLGPVLLLPTGTDDLLSTRKWGAGPTGVVLRQSGPWTYGGLVNHVWSYAGDDNRNDVNSTFLQPFLSYTTDDAWTFTLNSESTYDWTSDEWSVPINAMVAKLVTIDKQPISFQAGVRYYAASSDNGPEGFGARAAVTFLFPK
ncbi:transporter [Roseibium aggregatum]|uniref:transporter n=1 Tax=Roseibium aggregatum TaxID=187304 RepID=UPI001A8E40CD|nr:transporter [Roseibium aggregatum]MBN8179741.1 transporter [Roseibium aggregatum]UES47440.1 transporter [Roseibium aggregatum]